MHNLESVWGVVEATSFEQLCLWREDRERGVEWDSDNLANVVTVGTCDNRPVNVCLTTSIISGKIIMFVDGISQVVDHEMINNWLKENLPKTAFNSRGFPRQTNAMNYHNVFRD